MAYDSQTTLIDIDEDILKLAGWGKLSASVTDRSGENIYGIPWEAPRVVKFNLATQKLTEIGPIVVGAQVRGIKWACGVLATDDCIYCPPWNAKYILKINTTNDGVEELKDVTLPEAQANNTDRELFHSAALASDGCMYAMPRRARRVLKFDPAAKTASSVGKDLGGIGSKYLGTVVGADGWVYGIPDHSDQLIKLDPNDPDNNIVDVVGSSGFRCGGGVLAQTDGHIYAAQHLSGKILKIDTKPNTNSVTWIGDSMELPSGRNYGWLHPTIGQDSCIYWPPHDANRVLKFDINTQENSLVGKDYGSGRYKWWGASMTRDNSIYSFPSVEKQILRIDTRPTNLPSSRKGTAGGLNDNPKKAKDRLNYQVYAEGITETVMPIEKSDVPFCVGIFGSWGSGKSFMWEELVARYKAKTKEKRDKIIEENEKEHVSILERSWVLAWAFWCSFANTIFAPIFNCSCGTSTLTKEENLAFMVIFFFPVSLIVWTLTITWVLVYNEELSLQRMLWVLLVPVGPGFLLWFMAFLVSITSIGMKHVLKFFIVARGWLVARFIEDYPGVTFQEELNNVSDHGWLQTLTKGQNDPEISLKFFMLHILVLVPARLLIALLRIICIPPSLVGKVRSHAWFEFVFGLRTGQHQQQDTGDIENQQQSLKWSQVSKVLKGKTNLRADSQIPRFGDKMKLATIEMWQMIYKNVISRQLLPMILNIKEDEDDDVTQYIPVKFNAWVYDGTDRLWAGMVEQLWTNVERERGWFSVRIHRATRELSNELDDDDLNTKIQKRGTAWRRFFLKILFSLIIAYIIIERVVPKQKTWLDYGGISMGVVMISILQCRSGVFVIVQELLRSRGTWVLNEVKKMEKFSRADFSEETGFMGQVKKEIEYLFDYLKSNHIVDEEIKRRILLRLLLFIDDLDRITDSAVTIQVLKAVSLLLQDAPITCYLAIDSRRVVTSIEQHFGDRFTGAGLNGYEYLDKIVQLPFCLPNLNGVNKKNYVMKELQNNALNPLTVYNRLQFLHYHNFEMTRKVFFPSKDDHPVNKKEAICALVPTLKGMIESGIFDAIAEETTSSSVLGGMGPDEVYKTIVKIKARILTDSTSLSREDERVIDQFVYLISAGIEYLRKGKETKPTPTTESDNQSVSFRSLGHGSFSQEVEAANTVTRQSTEISHGMDNAMSNNATASPQPELKIPAQEQQDPEEATLPPPLGGPFRGNNSTAKNTEISGDNDVDAMSNNNTASLEFRNAGDEYQTISSSLATSEELEWFAEYSKYFSGRPRKIKRIINCYMVSRYVANALRAEKSISMVFTFNKKLLKIIILLEQWPYRMAWLLLVAENLQQEFEMKSYEEKLGRVPAKDGERFTCLFEKSYGTGKDMMHYGDLFLIDIYDRFVQVLIHSSPDSATQLQRDGDAQVFEHLLLLHDDSDTTSIMKLKDISLPGEDSYCQDTLRSYAFNLQTHMTQKVAIELENCLLFSNVGEDESSDLSEAGQPQLSPGSYSKAVTVGREDKRRRPYRHVTFERKSSFFDGRRS